jgi:hypothetical protein
MKRLRYRGFGELIMMDWVRKCEKEKEREGKEQQRNQHSMKLEVQKSKIECIDDVISV